MPSEKRRYLESRHGPPPPVALEKLPEILCELSADHLAAIVLNRSYSDDILSKVLVIAATFRVHLDPARLKEAVDYACHFPDYIRYFEQGHGQILDEIGKGAAELFKTKPPIAIELAEYALEVGEKLAENFEEDWEWREGLRELAECIDRFTSGIAG